MRILLATFVAAVLIVGIGLRFSGLANKFYYDDEVVSSLREAGHTAQEFGAAFDGRVRTIGALSGYLSDRTTPPSATIHSLAAEDPQHPPLYYLLARYWTHTFGDSLSARRSLAALFGSLAILAALWFGYELFGSLASGAVLAALVAVSPFNLIYSQQNREYSAWLFFLALAGATLLRAMRRPAWGRWRSTRPRSSSGYTPPRCCS